MAVLGAWLQALDGRPAGAERWADAAEHPIPAPDANVGTQTPPDGSTMASHLAMVRGLLCRDGVDRMRADAQAALAGLSPASPALLPEGIAVLLDGQADRADPILAHAVEVGAHAETLAEQALATLQAGQLDDYIMSSIVHAVTARTALHRGSVPAAREHLAEAARLRPLLTQAIPWLAVQTLLELGRAYLALDDLAGVRAVLRQARDVLRLRPDLGTLPAQVEELWSRLDMAGTVLPGASSSLTTAELRLPRCWRSSGCRTSACSPGRASPDAGVTQTLPVNRPGSLSNASNDRSRS